MVYAHTQTDPRSTLSGTAPFPGDAPSGLLSLPFLVNQIFGSLVQQCCLATYEDVSVRGKKGCEDVRRKGEGQKLELLPSTPGDEQQPTAPF